MSCCLRAHPDLRSPGFLSLIVAVVVAVVVSGLQSACAAWSVAPPISWAKTGVTNNMATAAVRTLCLCISFSLIAFSLINVMATETKSSAALTPIQDHVRRKRELHVKRSTCRGCERFLNRRAMADVAPSGVHRQRTILFQLVQKTFGGP
jgi:hypothetical protein